jgi:hypothetical protein
LAGVSKSDEEDAVGAVQPPVQSCSAQPKVQCATMRIEFRSIFEPGMTGHKLRRMHCLYKRPRKIYPL